MKRASALLAVATLALPAVLGACGGGSSGSSSSSSADLQVIAQDIKYDKKDYSLTTGLKTIALKNQGSLSHTLLVEQDGKAVAGFKLSASAKQTVSGKVNLPAGTYTIFCDVTGHRAAGMEATLTVN
jgi:plastocyanin